MACWGGASGLAGGAMLGAQGIKIKAEARVLTFKLGGKATLPPPKNAPAALPEPPAMTADAATLGLGRALFNGYCGVCHGLNAVGAGVLPDLRYLTADKHTIFAGILAGAYASKGMPSFSALLTPEYTNAVHQYVIKRAHDLKDDLNPPKEAAK